MKIWRVCKYSNSGVEMVERGERGNHTEGAEKTLKTLRFPWEFCELRVQTRPWVFFIAEQKYPLPACSQTVTASLP